MSGRPQLRQHLPFRPLVEYIRATRPPDEYMVFDDEWPDGRHAWQTIADLVRVDRGAVLRWEEEGSIPLAGADRAACVGLRVHPFDIWGTAYYDVSISYLLCLDDRHRRRVKARARKSGADPEVLALQELAATG